MAQPGAGSLNPTAPWSGPIWTPCRKASSSSAPETSTATAWMTSSSGRTPASARGWLRMAASLRGWVSAASVMSPSADRRLRRRRQRRSPHPHRRRRPRFPARPFRRLPRVALLRFRRSRVEHQPRRDLTDGPLISGASPQNTGFPLAFLRTGKVRGRTSEWRRDTRVLRRA